MGTQVSMDQLKAMNKKFTQSIYGCDETEFEDVTPNEQHVIEYMVWRIEKNGMSATAVARQLNREGLEGKRGGQWTATSVLKVMRNMFHERRKKWPYPQGWGA